MSTSRLLRGVPLLRLSLQHRSLAAGISTRRPSTLPDDDSCRSGSVKDPPKYPRFDNPAHWKKWKHKKQEILRDVQPIALFTKEILHSNRYMDGECLTAEDEKGVVEKLLAHHPHSEDKIGCGLYFIMVDRHTQFKHSRCLFVVSIDGESIDFSYQKCIKTYIRDKYPSHAERFIKAVFPCWILKEMKRK